MKISKILFIASLLLGFHFAQGQNKKIVTQASIVTFEGYYSYLVINGFSISPGTGQSFVFTATPSQSFEIRMVNPTEVSPPSLDQNFVKTESILTSGITTEAPIKDLPVSQKSTSYSYQDELGRSLQDVVIQASPSGKDFIQPYAYNADGRMEFDYLPYSYAPTKAGQYRPSGISEQGTFYNTTSKVSSDTKPWDQYVYERSPLNRVKESYGPGNAWYSNLKKGVQTFSPAGTAIPYWQINGFNLPSYVANYPQDILFQTTTTDENNNLSYEYSDFRGLMVRKVTNGLVTVYVYDQIGNLRFIIPPKLAAVNNVTQTLADNWCFQYQYDNRQRLVKQKSPGMDWVYNIYDDWDRLVATQDGNQRIKSTPEWTFIKYDNFNRPVVTGIFTSNNTFDQMVAAATGAHHEDRITTSAVGYSLNLSFPTSTLFAVTEANLLTINYYDDYGFLSIVGWDAEANNYTFTNPSGFANTQLTSIKTQVTGTKTKVMGTNTWLNAVVYYDKYYQPIQAFQENHMAGMDRVTFAYNFAGWALKTQRYHTTSAGSVTTLEEYEYDATGRLTKTYHTLDNGTRTLLAANNYNELGQVVENNIHSTDNGATYLQSVDYRYNIRGWLTHINNSTLTADANNDDTNDLFGMQLVYNEETPVVGVTGSTNTVVKQFGGNIAEVKWKTDNKKTTPLERIYGYQYDSKDRLSQGFYAANNAGAWTAEDDLYNEENLTYDDNGNLNSLRRFAKIAGAKGTLDDLNYNTNGTASTSNKLINVEDAGNATLGFVNNTTAPITEFAFDTNGNLTSDLNNTVTDVKYNYLNLPEKFVIDGGTANECSVEFTYDASGYLLKKVYKKAGVVEPAATVDYVNGIQYYNNTLSLVFTPNGRATKFNGAWEYEYFMTDHLGNTRLVFGYLHDADVYKATMESFYATQEESTFKKIAATRWTDPVYNRTPRNTDVPIPDKSAKLNGSLAGQEVGPGKVLTITSGDKLNLEVYVRYNPGSGSTSDVIANLVSAATTALNVTLGENPAAFNSFNTYLPGFVDGITYNTGQPKAYLNYILFDANYANPQYGYKALTVTAASGWEKLSLPAITAPYNGFAYIYLTNESNYNVYFDDFMIIHEKNTKSLRVTESTDYYPYGLPIEGTRYIDESRLVNSYGYQGDYAEFDKRTGWNRFALRGNYDARLGRWMSADPYSQFASPYVGMGNSAVNGTDPDGGFFGLSAMASSIIEGGLLGAAVGTAIGLKYDKKHWYRWTLGGAALGVLGGYLIERFALFDVPGINDRKFMKYPKPKGARERVTIMKPKVIKTRVLKSAEFKFPIDYNVTPQISGSLRSYRIPIPKVRRQPKIEQIEIQRDDTYDNFLGIPQTFPVKPFQGGNSNFVDYSTKLATESELMKVINYLSSNPNASAEIQFQTDAPSTFNFTASGLNVGIVMQQRVAAIRGLINNLNPSIGSRISMPNPTYGNAASGSKRPTPTMNITIK